MESAGIVYNYFQLEAVDVAREVNGSVIRPLYVYTITACLPPKVTSCELNLNPSANH